MRIIFLIIASLLCLTAIVIANIGPHSAPKFQFCAGLGLLGAAIAAFSSVLPE